MTSAVWFVVFALQGNCYQPNEAVADLLPKLVDFYSATTTKPLNVDVADPTWVQSTIATR